LEDSASVEGFLSVWVSTENNGNFWWLMVVVGDGEKAWVIGNDFGRKKGEEMAFFLNYMKAKVEMLK